MSWVTNAILHVGIGDEHLLPEVNRFFERDRIRGFVSLDDESLPSGWYGGTKFLEARVSVGAFNYLNMTELLNHLRSIEWSQPESVQLIVLDQEDYKFRVVDLFPNEQVIYEQQETITNSDMKRRVEMGAWGADSLENDDALDWFNKFCDAPDKRLITDAFAAVNDIGGEYLEAPECSEALAAAEVISVLKGAPSRNLSEDAQQCAGRLKVELTGDMVPAALKAVERIRTDSELKDLWDESGSSNEWYAALDDLESRLRQ